MTLVLWERPDMGGGWSDVARFELPIGVRVPAAVTWNGDVYMRCEHLDERDNSQHPPALTHAAFRRAFVLRLGE